MMAPFANTRGKLGWTAASYRPHSLSPTTRVARPETTSQTETNVSSMGYPMGTRKLTHGE